MLAPKRKPNEICLAKYDMNSIKTSNGNKPKGHPEGTNKENNLRP